MDLFDKFFKKFSYKFPKGYPDINDVQDMLMLEGMIKSILGENFNPLKFFDLQKYGGPRLKILDKKIQNGELFDMVSGEKIVLMYTKPEYEELFKNADAAAIKKIGGPKINSILFFKDKNNKEYAIKDLLKNTDFGGRGVGSGTKAEDIALLDISNQLKEIGPVTVVLKEGGKSYKGIDGATTFRGTPKADFSLDAGGEELIFISHKDGKGPKDFQQYGGFKGINQYTEVKSFVEDVRKLTGGQLKRGQSFRRKISDEEIKLKSVYGLNFGNEPGLNNCQVLLQGPLTLDRLEDNTYLLGATHKIITPTLPSGEYEPYLYVTFRSDRNNEGIKDARFGVYPEAYKRSAVEI